MQARLDHQTISSAAAKKARQSICHLLGTEKFFFASSARQAIHQLFFGIYLHHIRETGRTHILSLAHENSPIAAEAKQLEKLGCTVKHLPVNEQGQVTREALAEAIRARTALVSLSWADPLTGVIQPIMDLGDVCREKEVLFHVDASAVLGKLFFRFQDLPLDFLTFEGSVLPGPEGTGGLLVRQAAWLEEASAANAGQLAQALEKAQQHIEHVCLETGRLRNKLEAELTRHLPDTRVLFQASERVSHISAIEFAGVHAEALLFSLERLGVHATPAGLSSVSFALSYETSEEEIDYAIEKIISAVNKLRTYSVCLARN